MNYLHQQFELVRLIQAYFRKKMLINTTFSNQDEIALLYRKYQALKQQLPAEYIPLLLQTLKLLSSHNCSITNEHMMVFFQEVLSENDKAIYERMQAAESECIQNISLAGNMLPLKIIEEFPTATSTKLNFDIVLYHQILPFIELASRIEKTANYVAQAFKLSVLFDNLPSVIDYLRAYSNANKHSQRVVHDACLFSLPADHPGWNKTLWQKLIKKHLATNGKFKNLLPFAGELERKLPNISSNSSIAELDQAYMQINYQRSHEHLSAAKLFHQCGMPEPQFNRYLDEILPNAIDSPNIPDVSLIASKDETLETNYYLVKLAHTHPLAAVLGKKTNCCQLLGGAGEACAIHGITSQYGGFYVVYEGAGADPKPTDPVIAQCWAWRSKNRALIFDSLEFSVNVQTDAKKSQIIKLYKQLADCLVSQAEYRVPCVRVGIDGMTPRNFGISGVGEHNILEEPIDYAKYRDSTRGQRIVAINRDILFEMEAGSAAVSILIHWVQSCINNSEEIAALNKHALSSKVIELEAILQNANTIFNMLTQPYLNIDWDLLDSLYSQGYCLNITYLGCENLLKQAYSAKDFAKIEWLLNRGYSIEDLKKAFGWQTDLTIYIVDAAQERQWGLVRILYKKSHELSPAITDKIMYFAILHDNPDMIDFLLEVGGEITPSALASGAEQGAWKSLKHIFDTFSHSRDFLLALASSYQEWPMVWQYVKKDAKSCESAQISALNLAGEYGKWGLVKYYIKNQAYSGEYAISDIQYIALRAGNWRMINWIIRQDVAGISSYIAILYLAERKQWEKVKFLILTYHININLTYPQLAFRYPELNICNYSTVLTIAIMQENIGVMQWLLQHNADLSAKNISNLSGFIQGFNSGKILCVYYLLEHHADKVQEDVIFIIMQGLIHKQEVAASVKENVLAVSPKYSWQELLNFVSDINLINTYHKRTLLTAVCSSPDTLWGVIQHLVVERKAAINLKDGYGDTPLHALCRASKIDLIQLEWFKNNGADLHAKNDKNESLIAVCWGGSPNLRTAYWLLNHGVDDVMMLYPKLLFAEYGGLTMVLISCFAGDLKLIKALVNKGADLTGKDEGGQNAIMLAAKGWGCNLELLQWLNGQKGIDINAKNNKEEDALYAACSSHKWQVAKWLVELGANINSYKSEERLQTNSLYRQLNRFFINQQQPPSIVKTPLYFAVSAAKIHGVIWDTVAWILQHPQFDLTIKDIYAEPLSEIEKYAPETIKNLVNEKLASLAGSSHLPH